MLNNSNIWPRSLDHISHKNFSETITANVVLGIPNIKIDLNNVCGPCQIWIQIWMSHKMMQHPSITRVLELLDYYSRFTWVSFLRDKLDTFNAFKVLFLKLMCKKNKQLKKAMRIMSDHGKEFENSLFTKFYNKHGIYHELYGFNIPQQNGVKERKNKAL